MSRRHDRTRFMADRAAYLRDREAAELFEWAHPEVALRRRDFIARTAATAGLAALAGVLPGETLIAEAAHRQTQFPLPKPRDVPLDTIVVLMMENRSFDHYFGWYRKADGRNEGLAYPDRNGNPVATHRLTPDFQGCGHPDPDHSWDGGRHQVNGGRMDGFVQGNAAGDGSDEFAAGYYLKEDLGFISHAGEAFTLYDRFFCSTLSSTYPNRWYMWAADAGGRRTNQIPPGPEGWPEETIFDRAKQENVSATYYNSDLPVSALYGIRGVADTRPIEQYYADAAAGKLSKIVFIDPPFRDGGGGDGLSADEHPHGDVRLGQAFMSDVVHAFMESPQWKRGALFVDYDEHGGFFDHVPPGRVPDSRASRNPADDWGQLGIRVPALCVSPFVRRGYVAHQKLAFESILKLISYRFNLGHLNIRHRYAKNIGRTLDFRHPRLDPPDLPDPPMVATTSCTAQGHPPGSGRQAARPKEHDLAELETSGYLDSIGYKVVPATPDRIFRKPDSVKKAYFGR
jgi:phospholipase C